MLTRLFVSLQYILPRYWLTAVVYRLARVRHTASKDFLITQFVRLFEVDTDDVKFDVPNGFATFNDFFIRELKGEARPIDSRDDAIVSPVDGTISTAGTLYDDSIVQAKGFEYSLDDLLATDLDDAHRYVDGHYATIYLAPYNYHRVHAPISGELVSALYVPGDLFSVNTATAAQIGGLFHRNERLILHFSTQHGPATLILIGALNVGSISTPWSGEIRPRKRGIVETIRLRNAATSIDKGELLGWFNMGSTVILLLPKGACEWRDTLNPGSTVRMGEAIGKRPDPGHE